MPDAASFDCVLKQALQGLDNEDVSISYDYFEDLKHQVRKRLDTKAGTVPGDSAIAQSALFSLFCDLALRDVPLSDVDDYGVPMLWPLLVKYAERHCNKWNKYYRAHKRTAAVVSLEDDPADHRASAAAGGDFVLAWETFYARLSLQDRQIVELRLQDKGLDQIAEAIERSQSTVSSRLQQIRQVLESA
jgi:hypothetical protein